MPVIKRQRSITPEDVILRLEKLLQVGRVVTHHLGYMVQSIVLQERIDEQSMSLKQINWQITKSNIWKTRHEIKYAGNNDTSDQNNINCIAAY